MIDKTTPAPLLDLSARSVYENFSDEALLSLNLPEAFPNIPDGWLDKSRESALLQRLSSYEGQTLSAEDFKGFRFHPDANCLVNDDRYAAACHLSLIRTLEEASAHPIIVNQINFAPQQLNDMRGIDRFGNVHISSHNTGEPSEEISLSAGSPTRLAELPDGLQRFVQPPPLYSGLTSCLSKSYIKPPVQPELLYNRAGNLILLDARDQQITLDTLPGAFFEYPSAIKSVHFSANGRFAVLLPQFGPVRLYDLGTGERLPVPRVSYGDSSVCRALVSNDGTLYMDTQWASHRVTPEGAVLTSQGMDQAYALSPDERFLLYRSSSDRSDDFTLRDLHNHREIPVTRTQIGSSTLPDISPDIALSPHNAMLCADYLTSRPASIAFSPLNALLAVAYGDGGIEVFDLMNADAHGARSLARTQISVQADIFSRPLVSFDRGFDHLQVVSYGDNNQLDVNSLTLGPLPSQ